MQGTTIPDKVLTKYGPCFVEVLDDTSMMFSNFWTDRSDYLTRQTHGEPFIVRGREVHAAGQRFERQPNGKWEPYRSSYGSGYEIKKERQSWESATSNQRTLVLEELAKVAYNYYLTNVRKFVERQTANMISRCELSQYDASEIKKAIDERVQPKLDNMVKYNHWVEQQHPDQFHGQAVDEIIAGIDLVLAALKEKEEEIQSMKDAYLDFKQAFAHAPHA